MFNPGFNWAITLCLLGALILSFGTTSYAEPPTIQPDLLFAPPAGPPSFDEDSLLPEPGGTIFETKPTITVRIFVDKDDVVVLSISVFIDGCVTTSGNGSFGFGDDGVRLNGDPDFQDNASSITVTVNLQETDCELAEGDQHVSVSAKSEFGDMSDSHAWQFEVELPTGPGPPSGTPGPRPFRIDSIDPASATAGSEVTVRGAGFEARRNIADFFGINHFYPGTRVYFNGRFVQPNVRSPGELRFTMPQGVACGRHTVQLYNEFPVVPLPESIFPGFTEVKLLTVLCQFQIPELPASPQIDRISPESGPPGAQVTVYGTGEEGTGFYEDEDGEAVSVVMWDVDPNITTLLGLTSDGTQLPTTYAADDELRFAVPQDAECDRTYHLRVRGPGQTIFGFYSNAVPFVINCISPLILSNPQPADGSTISEIRPLVSVELSTGQPNASIQANSIEMAIDQCGGLVFKTISGGTFSNGVFSVNLDALSGTPCTLSDGPATVTVQARDSFNNEGSFSWSFTVQAEQVQNLPPTIELAYTPPNPQAGDTVTIVASAADPEGGPLSYQWYLNDLLQTNVTDADGTISNIQAGNYTVRVVVVDDQGASAQDVLSFSVPQANGNFIPSVDLSCAPTTAVVGQQFQCVADAFDPDGDPLSYAWFVNGNQQNANGPSVQGSFQNPGTYTVRVVVGDGQGAAADEVQLTVTSGPSGSPAPSPPGSPPIVEVLDVNGNDHLDDAEIQQAIAYFEKGQNIPGSDENLDRCMMDHLVRLWLQGAALSNVKGAPCGTLSASPMAPLAGTQWAARDPRPVLRALASDIFELSVGEMNVLQLQIQLFDLSGRLWLEREGIGSRLSFRLQNFYGHRPANGVYLYVVTVKGVDGRHWRSMVQKLAVFN